MLRNLLYSVGLLTFEIHLLGSVTLLLFSSGRMPPNSLLLPSVTYHPNEGGSGGATMSTLKARRSRLPYPHRSPSGARSVCLRIAAFCGPCQLLACNPWLPSPSSSLIGVPATSGFFSSGPMPKHLGTSLPRLAGVTQHASCI